MRLPFISDQQGIAFIRLKYLYYALLTVPVIYFLYIMVSHQAPSPSPKVPTKI